MKCIPLTCGYFLLILPLPSLYILSSCPSILFWLASFFFSGICIPLCYWWDHLIPLLCCLFIFLVRNTWADWCLTALLWFCAEGRILSWATITVVLQSVALHQVISCIKTWPVCFFIIHSLLYLISFSACFFFYILLIILFIPYFPFYLTLFYFVVSSCHS